MTGDPAVRLVLRRPGLVAGPLLAVMAVGGGTLIARTPAERHVQLRQVAVSVPTSPVALPSFGVQFAASPRADRAVRDVQARAAALQSSAPATASRPAATTRLARRTRVALRPAAVTHAWVRPSGGPLTSPFGPRWGRFHYGIDLGAPYGAPIYAATDGTVVYVGPCPGYGTLVVIADWDGTLSVYGHMSSYARGLGPVRAGEVIAYVGAEGDATGPHLHFEVRTDPRTPVDPIPFLTARGVGV